MASAEAVSAGSNKHGGGRDASLAREQCCLGLRHAAPSRIRKVTVQEIAHR